MTAMNSNFSKGNFSKPVNDEDDNELFMGGLPITMPEN
jgi:hypothetical protein